MISFIIQFLIEQRLCKHFLQGQKQQNDKLRQLTIQFDYLLAI